MGIGALFFTPAYLDLDGAGTDRSLLIGTNMGRTGSDLYLRQADGCVRDLGPYPAKPNAALVVDPRNQHNGLRDLILKSLPPIDCDGGAHGNDVEVTSTFDGTQYRPGEKRRVPCVPAFDPPV